MEQDKLFFRNFVEQTFLQKKKTKQTKNHTPTPKVSTGLPLMLKCHSKSRASAVSGGVANTNIFIEIVSLSETQEQSGAHTLHRVTLISHATQLAAYSGHRGRWHQHAFMY